MRASPAPQVDYIQQFTLEQVMTPATAIEAADTFPWRSVGIWMVALLAVSMAINTYRAFADPVGFATYLGLPLTDPRDVGMVHIYGLRAAFLALFGAILIFRGDVETLKFFALAALVMPIGDALLTYNAGASTATIIRHIGYVFFLALTAFLLHRWSIRSA
jgi:Domain of unknown function (DUF4267)